MSIDKSGEFWKGNTFSDIVEYIKVFSSENYIAEKVFESKCACNNNIYEVEHDPDEGFVKLKCSSCNKIKYIADCNEIEKDIEPKKLICGCKNKTFQICIGFSYRKKFFLKTDIKWITVGAMCTKCGILGSPSDWKIDYSPSLFLENQI